MKKLFYTLFLFLLLFCLNSCTNDNAISYEDTGQMIGQDAALCACCGNWIIKIEGRAENFQAVEIPESLGLDLIDAVFPIPIKLNWSFDPNSSCGHIIIEDIARNN